MFPYLITMNGPDDGKEYALDRDLITIGHDKSNILYIPLDTSISRRHAYIFRSGLDLFVEDLGSSNGTFFKMEGMPWRKLELHVQTLLEPGMWLKVGSVRVFQVVQFGSRHMLEQPLDTGVKDDAVSRSVSAPLQAAEQHTKAEAMAIGAPPIPDDHRSGEVGPKPSDNPISSSPPGATMDDRPPIPEKLQNPQNTARPSINNEFHP